MKRVAVTCFLAGACAPGLVHLDATKARTLDLGLVTGETSFCANSSKPPELAAVVGYDDGTQLAIRTPSRAEGRVPPHELAYRSVGGQVDARGQLVIRDALLAMHDRPVTIRAHVPGRPAVSATLEVTPRFDCGGRADFSPRAAGAAGPHLEVALAYVDTRLNGRLILVRVRSDGDAEPRYHLVDPDGGQKLVVSAAGGAGGQGASGHTGSDGARGSDGTSGSSGGTCANGQDGGDGSRGQDGGDGGDGARGGDGGDGGAIVVLFPDAFADLPERVGFDVSAGAAGQGGPGGDGGDGGAGGHGGRGGSGGSSFGSDGETCTTFSGRDGHDGSSGSDGSSGRAGPAGRPGRAGTVTAAARDVETLFADEIAQGWAIVRPGVSDVGARPGGAPVQRRP